MQPYFQHEVFVGVKLWIPIFHQTSACTTCSFPWLFIRISVTEYLGVFNLFPSGLWMYLLCTFFSCIFFLVIWTENLLLRIVLDLHQLRYQMFLFLTVMTSWRSREDQYEKAQNKQSVAVRRQCSLLTQNASAGYLLKLVYQMIENSTDKWFQSLWEHGFSLFVLAILLYCLCVSEQFWLFAAGIKIGAYDVSVWTT